MFVMFTFVKSSYKSKAPVQKRARAFRKLARPSGYQFNMLRDVVRYLQTTRCKRRSLVYERLKEQWGLQVKELRMQSFGGVGTSQWMPLRRCYRIQVGAGHINRNGACFNYADCVEIYDYIE